MRAKAELVTKPIEQILEIRTKYERINSIPRKYKNMKIKKSNLKIHLYDVGTGDGELSREIYANLRQNGFNNLEMALIDIDDGIDWNHADSECVSNIQNKGKEVKNGHLRRLLYNGRDLGLKIREDLNHETAKENGKAKENGGEIKSEMMKELIIVTFNHSLHHWPSLESQEESIRQLGEVLPIGSIVILKEHYNLINDDQISLNHLFIHFRNNLFHYLADKETSNPKKCRRDRESASKLMDEYVKESGAHNYLSPFILESIMTKNGFELYSFTDAKPDDPNRTVVYSFQKVKDNLSENPINPIYEEGATAGEGNNRKRKESLEQKATDHCLQNWILYLHLAEISAEIVENLKDAGDSEIYKRILGPKFVNVENQHWEFLDNLNRFSHKIVKQLNPPEKVGRLRSLTNRAMSIFKKNDAKNFYDLLKTLNVQIRVKKMEEIEIAKKSVKFEIGFRLPGHEKEEIAMNEVRTRAFIAEIQKMINKKIPKVIDKICEYFTGKYTEKKALESISKLLKGEDEIDANSKCLHKWIFYLYLGKISKEIVEHLKKAKNHKIYERILGTTKVDEQWELMKNLDKFLIDLEERLSEFLITKSGRMIRTTSMDIKISEEKEKYYILLKDLEEELTVKMEGTDNEKEEEKKNKSPSRSRKETPIFTDSDESSVSSFELSSASSSDESLFDFLPHKHSNEEENDQHHHGANSKLQQKEMKLKEMEGKLQKQQNELKEMQNLKKKLQKELNETQNRIQNHENEIGKTQKEIDEMKRLIKEQQQKEEEERQRRLKQRQKAKQNKTNKQRNTLRPRARQETTFQHIQQSSHTYVKNGNNYGSPLLCTFHYSSFCQTSYPIY